VRDDRAVVIFDGTCGFCTWSVLLLERPLGIRVTAVPYQWLSDAALAALGTSRAECRAAVQFIDRNGTRWGGADAINALLRDHPLFGLAVRGMMRLPPVARFEHRAYAWIATHREAISKLLGTRGYALIKDDDAGAPPHR